MCDRRLDLTQFDRDRLERAVQTDTDFGPARDFNPSLSMKHGRPVFNGTEGRKPAEPQYGLYHSPDIDTLTLEFSTEQPLRLFTQDEAPCVCKDPKHVWAPGPDGYELQGYPLPNAKRTVYE